MEGWIGTGADNKCLDAFSQCLDGGDVVTEVSGYLVHDLLGYRRRAVDLGNHVAVVSHGCREEEVVTLVELCRTCTYSLDKVV